MLTPSLYNLKHNPDGQVVHNGSHHIDDWNSNEVVHKCLRSLATSFCLLPIPDDKRAQLIKLLSTPEDIQMIKVVIADVDGMIDDKRGYSKIRAKLLPDSMIDAWKKLAKKFDEQTPDWVDSATFEHVLKTKPAHRTMSRIQGGYALDHEQTDEEVTYRVLGWAWLTIAILVITASTPDEQESGAFFAVYCSTPISLLYVLGPTERQLKDADLKQEARERRERGRGYDSYFD